MSPVHSPEGFKRDEWMLDGDEAGGNLCSGELAVEDSAASRCEKVGRRVARCGWYSDMNKKYKLHRDVGERTHGRKHKDT